MCLWQLNVSANQSDSNRVTRCFICCHGTFEGVQGFAGADSGQGLLVVELVVEVGRGGVGGGDRVGAGSGLHFDLSL